MSAPLLVLDGVSHRGASLPRVEVAAGEGVALVGQPGTGKALALRVAGGLRPPGGATLERTCRLAYVFAEGGLLATLSVRDNLLLPLVHGGHPDAAHRVDEVLQAWGLVSVAGTSPLSLSASAQRIVQFARVEALGAVLAVVEEAPQGSEVSDRVRRWWRRHLGAGGGILTAATTPHAVERVGARVVSLDPVAAPGASRKGLTTGLPGAITQVLS